MTRKFVGGLSAVTAPGLSGITIWRNRDEFCGFIATYSSDCPERFSEYVDHDIPLYPPLLGGVIIPSGAGVAFDHPLEKISLNA
jgi:hypothetical protein